MTNKIKIVTDSSIQLTDEEAKKYEIHVVPLTIVIDKMIYTDGVNITRPEFMAKMAEAKNLPQTSQPSIGTFLDLYDELSADGSEILSVHMSHGLSGTVNAARQAAQISKAAVTVIDSEYIDRAMAFQVIEAAKLAQAGKERDEIIAAMEKIKERTKLFLSVSSLNNLVKGGRLSKVSGLLSNLLNIKVVLKFEDNAIVPIHKGRGIKTINNFYNDLVNQMKETTAPILGIGISHADDLGLANKIKEQLNAIFPEISILVAPTSPVVATHTGAGALAVIFYTA